MGGETHLFFYPSSNVARARYFANGSDGSHRLTVQTGSGLCCEVLCGVEENNTSNEGQSKKSLLIEIIFSGAIIMGEIVGRGF